MRDPSRPLHLPRPLPSLTAAVVLLVIGGLWTGLALLVLLFHPETDPDHVVTFVMGIGLGVAGVSQIVRRQTVAGQRWRWAREAGFLGLEEFQLHVYEDDIEPFLNFPLFRFADPERDAAELLAWGKVQGRSMLVLTYRYSGRFLNARGDEVIRGDVQTIALVRRVGPLPDFHLSPKDNDWDEMSPDWPRDLGLGRIVQTLNEDSRDPSLLRGKDRDAIDALFTPERVRQLRKLSGWTIESRDGDLLLYRQGEVIEAKDLERFVQRASDFVDVLAGEAPALPDREQGTRPNETRSPGSQQVTGERRANKRPWQEPDDRLTTGGRD